MAEAHEAVAFSFAVTQEGVDFNVNYEILRQICFSTVRQWRKRVARWKNTLRNGVYPLRFSSWIAIVIVSVLGAVMGYEFPIDVTAKRYTTWGKPLNLVLSSILFGSLTWIFGVLFVRYFTKQLLTYQNWAHEPVGKMSRKTKVWLGILKLVLGKTVKLNQYQGVLPKLPLPSLDQTIERYLKSVKPIYSSEDFVEIEKSAADFKKGIGRRLQFVLMLKTWWSTNYVTDWWEEYVYMSGRGPIMVNSNYFGLDAIFRRRCVRQSARAAGLSYRVLQYLRKKDRDELAPLRLMNTVPLCSAQYERQFATTRVPGVERDVLRHWADTRHVAVLHAGRVFKLAFRKGNHWLTAPELEVSYQAILDDNSRPLDGEDLLPALTAGDRKPWAEARSKYFAAGTNKASLDAVEQAAFVLVLSDKAFEYDPDNSDRLDAFSHECLHGDGKNIWFDKSFNIIVGTNGMAGMNCEHSWADAPVSAHLWEVVNAVDLLPNSYTENGHCPGCVEVTPPAPIRLKWELSEELLVTVRDSYSTAVALLEDVELHSLVLRDLGKGAMKGARVSPDAFVQMAMQLAFWRDQGRDPGHAGHPLTYESCMTRLFREGRTDTVRSCSVEACAFVRVMADSAATPAARLAAFRTACDAHQTQYRNVLTGGGVDRHLFCLYVVSRYFRADAPFLDRVLAEPWRLSTSQTPHSQTSAIDVVRNPDYVCAGGGFGPVADTGYGVAYMFAGEDITFAHISCKKSFIGTDAHRFAREFTDALRELRALTLPNPE